MNAARSPGPCLHPQVKICGLTRPDEAARCAKLGADVMTGPLSSIEGLLKHPLTDIGLEKFLADYRKGNP